MTRQSRARHQGTYRRGEDSRQRLIEAGLDVFGHYGFEGASTRLLANKANVNLSAIPYYFGGKEGLYRAVVEHIAAMIAERQVPLAIRAGSALENPDLSRTELFQLLSEILDSLAAMIIGSKDADRWARIVIREQMDPSPAFDILYEGVMSRVHGVCTALVARLLNQSADDPDTLIRTTTIIGQILVFRAARGLVFKRSGWKEFTDERIAMIQAVIREHARTILLEDRTQQR